MNIQSVWFEYNKQKVLQALRYHFISRREIKILMILVNVFALLSAGLFFFKKVSPLAFLLSSVMWFVLMIAFWYALPRMVYRRAKTFQDRFRVAVGDLGLSLENRQIDKKWEWSSFQSWMESPHFYHLYFDARSFFILPKDAFEGDDVHEVRKIFREHIRK
jgi:uncharacterized membrane protein